MAVHQLLLSDPMLRLVGVIPLLPLAQRHLQQQEHQLLPWVLLCRPMVVIPLWRLVLMSRRKVELQWSESVQQWLPMVGIPPSVWVRMFP